VSLGLLKALYKLKSKLLLSLIQNHTSSGIKSIRQGYSDDEQVLYISLVYAARYKCLSAEQIGISRGKTRLMRKLGNERYMSKIIESCETTLL